ncbi:MAG: TonB family protein, partial [Nitrospinaceae bacterium]
GPRAMKSKATRAPTQATPSQMEAVSTGQEQVHLKTPRKNLLQPVKVPQPEAAKPIQVAKVLQFQKKAKSKARVQPPKMIKPQSQPMAKVAPASSQVKKLKRKTAKAARPAVAKLAPAPAPAAVVKPKISAPKKTRINRYQAAVPAPVLAPAAVVPTQDNKKVLKELDQVAALAPAVVRKKKKLPKNSILEDQVKELEALKKINKPIPSRKAPLSLEAPEMKPLAAIRPKDQNAKMREFDKLVKSKRKVQSTVVKTRENQLLKELDAISQLTADSPRVAPVPVSDPVASSRGGEVEEKMEKMRENLASLNLGNLQVNVELGGAASSKKLFKSRIHKLSSPSLQGASQAAALRGPAGKDASSYNRPGPASADILSRYVGLIEEKVFSNWKTPVGAEHNEVKVSFYIFPGGNIDKPELVASSKQEVLDNLALRAVQDSEPFSAFPSELKEPNLHIIIHFRYVYQNQ